MQEKVLVIIDIQNDIFINFYNFYIRRDFLIHFFRFPKENANFADKFSRLAD
jgi:hypothetical protein